MSKDVGFNEGAERESCGCDERQGNGARGRGAGVGYRRQGARHSFAIVPWNIQRPGTGQLEALLEELERFVAWDAALLQEVFAPGADEAQCFEWDSDGPTTKQWRGHSAFFSRSGCAVVMHRRWSATIHSVWGRGSQVGVVFAGGSDANVVFCSVGSPPQLTGLRRGLCSEPPALVGLQGVGPGDRRTASSSLGGRRLECRGPRARRGQA
mmetsp:Transcript_86143/g.239757  ORF Transcript_86143/g.239757 Transcript_86143/m.239757 type:complete len:210 (-) Transcript_86143:150-779(-)